VSEYSLPYFGLLPTESLEEYYEAHIAIRGQKVKIDLNFEHQRADKALWEALKYFLERIEKFDQQNQGYIQSDFEDQEKNLVKDYLSFHLEELGQDFLKQMQISEQAPDKLRALLAKLQLKRIGIYPDQKYDACFAIFDYTLNTSLSDELIVINTNQQGVLEYLAWES